MALYILFCFKAKAFSMLVKMRLLRDHRPIHTFLPEPIQCSLTWAYEKLNDIHLKLLSSNMYNFQRKGCAALKRGGGSMGSKFFK